MQYLGRSDGIGNRVEEIIKLGAFSLQQGIKVNYVWRNLYKHRNYEIHFKYLSEEVNVVTEDHKGDEISDINDLNNKPLNTEQILNSAIKIVPTFDISFPDKQTPIGVHLRGTDRIGRKNDPQFMADEKEFLCYMSKVIVEVNKSNPDSLFICADDQKYKELFLSKINSSTKIVEPIYDEGIPLEYIDFFALTLCEKIFMSSKFSTFAITAAMVSNKPIVSLSYDEQLADRYKANYEYQTDLPTFEDSVFDLKELKSIKQKLLPLFLFKCANTYGRLKRLFKA